MDISNQTYMAGQRIRVLVVDDHPVVVSGLTATIDVEPDMEVVGSATTGRGALSLFRELLPDVTVVDIGLRQDMNGIETILAIRAQFPEGRIIVLSVDQREDVIYRAIQAGATTYLFKDTLGDDLVRTIRAVHAGDAAIPADVSRKFMDRAKRSPLTSRELEVLRLLADGMRNKEVADCLRISEETVQSHLKNVFVKLGVNDRTKAVMIALQRGLIDRG